MKSIFTLFLLSLIGFAANSQAITIEVPGDPAFMTVEEAKVFGMHPEADIKASVVVNANGEGSLLTVANAVVTIGDAKPKMAISLQPVKCDLLIAENSLQSLIFEDKTRQTLAGFAGTN